MDHLPPPGGRRSLLGFLPKRLPGRFRGAIIAAGLLDLWSNDPDRDPERKLIAAAERILRTLASPEYLAEPRTNGGFLLKHGVGNLPGHSEVDVPLTYADYYFLYALRSYRWLVKTSE